MLTIRIVICIFSILLVLVDNHPSVANHIFNSISSLNTPKPNNILANCYRKVNRCVPLNTSLCLDVSLPYKYTSSNLFPHESLSSFEDYLQIIDIAHDYLERWKGLRSIPQCWKALQTTLCASFFPRCDNESLRVILPTYDMCRLTRTPCRLIDQYFKWPEFLHCENETLFPKKCHNLYTDLKFSNSIETSRCTAPLVPTDDSRIWYPGFDGCALHCVNPVYTEEQYNQLSKIIAYGTVLSILFTSFAICTFSIDRTCLQRRFYSLIVFHMNICALLSTFGWSLQFFKGRNEIVCRTDNTTRYGEPSKSDHFYCCTSFFLVYYFSFASLIWFVHLFKVFYKTFYGLSSGTTVHFNKFRFHMSAWSIPLIMTILISLLGEIDGDSLRGICFVGLSKPFVLFIFVLVPLTIGIVIGVYHSIRTVHILFKARSKCEIASRRRKSISMALIRIILFTGCNFLIYLVGLGIYVYELTKREDILKRFNDYLVCNLNISTVLLRKQFPINSNEQIFNNNNNNNECFYVNDVNSCRTYEPPSISLVYIQLVFIFSVNILISSWVWTRATISTWKRFLNRHFKSKKSPLHSKPYELIANSYLKREQIQQGLYVPNFISYHDDPVDMDLNSAQSQSISTNFQQNFPALLDRRYAVCGNNAFFNNSKKQQRHFAKNNASANFSFISQNLSLSDISQQQLSFESVEQMEMAFLNQRRKTKKQRERRRRGSDTSGSIISAAYITNKANKLRNNKNKNSFVTKSTSTGDLLNMILSSSMQTPLLTDAYAMIQAPKLGSFIATPGLAIMANCPLQPANYPVATAVASTQSHFQQNDKVRMNKTQYVSTFAFTHGMSDQTGHTIINPMIEKRRPDSVCSNAFYNSSNNNNHHNNNGDTSNCNRMFNPNALNQNQSNTNYNLNTLSSNHTIAPMYSSINGGNASGQFVRSIANNYMYSMFQQSHNAMLAYSNLIRPNAVSAVAATAADTTIPHYYNTQAAFLAYQQTKSLTEIENYMREHEKFKSLVSAHLTDNSECNSELLPISLTDSDSLNEYYSDDRLFQTTKMMVQERMKLVEDQVEQQERNEGDGQSKTKNQRMEKANNANVNASNRDES